MQQVFQSSRHHSSYGLSVLPELVNYKLENYSLLVLIKITNLILPQKSTLKSIAESF